MKFRFRVWPYLAIFRANFVFLNFLKLKTFWTEKAMAYFTFYVHIKAGLLRKAICEQQYRKKDFFYTSAAECLICTAKDIQNSPDDN